MIFSHFRERERETERDGVVACLIKDGMYRRCRCSYYKLELFTNNNYSG